MKYTRECLIVNDLTIKLKGKGINKP